MIRVILQELDEGTACHIGGPVKVNHRTMAIDAPELQAWLQGAGTYRHRSVIGSEIVDPPSDAVAKAGADAAKWANEARKLLIELRDADGVLPSEWILRRANQLLAAHPGD